MTIEEAKDILLKDMICENLVGLCDYECKKCAFDHDGTDIVCDEAYRIVTKHYKERGEINARKI